MNHLISYYNIIETMWQKRQS